jgi:hypothetical protein
MRERGVSAVLKMLRDMPHFAQYPPHVLRAAAWLYGYSEAVASRAELRRAFTATMAPRK